MGTTRETGRITVSPGSPTATDDRPSDNRPSAGRPAATQGMLFDEPVSAVPVPENVGFRGTVACRVVGITYRQLDYWARTGLVEPSVRPAHGSGTQRLYSFRDVLVLKIVKRLLDTGVSLQNIRAAVEHLRARGVADLAQLTLMSDGSSIYECTTSDEVVDLVQGGQGVFGIAVGRVWQEVRGELANLPTERASTTDTGASTRSDEADELAARRARRTS